MLCIHALYAQKQTANWFFGYNAGLDFMNTQTLNGVSGIPTYQPGPIYTGEGCFSLSDDNGDLLMSSDGVTVYNKSNATMDNGSNLLGHSSAAQSGIVIPVPGNANLYYIVTASAMEGARNGLNYNIIDISQNGGFGKVISKNQALPIAGHSKSDMYENLSVVGHNNGKDYWLIHRDRRWFFVWEVTKDGFSAPQLFDTGVDQGVYTSGTLVRAGMGYITFSPDGKKVIHCDAAERNNSSYITLADFDPATGTVSNIKNIKTNIQSLYGVEFSPSGKYVYIATHGGAGILRGLYIKHVDDLIEPSVTLTRSVADITNVQLAMDGRIYAIASGSRSLWAILDPDDGGTEIKEFSNFFPAGSISQGLPPFITSFLNVGEIQTNPVVPACINTEITFSVQIGNSGTGENKIARLEWDFGDSSLIVTETDMEQYIFSQKHIYKKPGTYTLTLTPYKGDGSIITDKTKTMEVKIARCILPVNHNISIAGY